MHAYVAPSNVLQYYLGMRTARNGPSLSTVPHTAIKVASSELYSLVFTVISRIPLLSTVKK